MSKQAKLREVDAHDAGLTGEDPDLIWRKGKPKERGWFNASRTQSESTWRWFDGKRWSQALTGVGRTDAAEAAELAKEKAYYDRHKPIEYRTYWPEGARVPREQGRQRL
jgi:hypothetical protein